MVLDRSGRIQVDSPALRPPRASSGTRWRPVPPRRTPCPADRWVRLQVFRRSPPRLPGLERAGSFGGALPPGTNRWSNGWPLPACRSPSSPPEAAALSLPQIALPKPRNPFTHLGAKGFLPRCHPNEGLRPHSFPRHGLPMAADAAALYRGLRPTLPGRALKVEQRLAAHPFGQLLLGPLRRTPRPGLHLPPVRCASAFAPTSPRHRAVPL